MIDILPPLFFMCVIPCTIFLYIFCPYYLKHGRNLKSTYTLSKNYFIIFYFVSIIFHIFKRTYSFFLILLIRRTIECIIYRYKHSRMTYLQFIYGIIYYLILSEHLMKYGNNLYERKEALMRLFSNYNNRSSLNQGMNIGLNQGDSFNLRSYYFSKSFITFNVLHSISHYFVFIKGWKYIHYILEIVIYLHLYFKIRSITLLLNVIYIIIFIYCSIRKRG
ncbi:hypothetical protein M153_13847000691 [Pseudoloma neurophilia]|uniref:Uncharacterized protein n=1 Tax=Pseudoloma neurophilia TaxID=146866 RepID=A0A0R0LX64_9MICR|nr:hypothetical protein M153_13847000691 [Pseudoloma neurophilia]